MIKKETMLIKFVEQIALDTIEMVVENAYISKTAIPGQFLHVAVDGQTLRRPISIADINREKETITLLFKIVGSGTAKLATLKPGMSMDVLGPSGNGFQIVDKEPSTILLIGGGIGVPPLYYLGKTLAEKNKEIISILGFQTEKSVFYEEKFSSLGRTYIVTNDGSYGETGFVTDVIEKAGQFDRYYSCGPVPMLKAITAKLVDKPGMISLEERMGCGVGACMACVIPTDSNGGYKKICSDGPVFHAQEVSL
ncbi:dihydroorotate dehydrogenase electron transfer subunit [Oceanobacillus saliphilus]|uniref:dihydroorotate dehydrogenase electron transfer subunit n=1 Tax=Oceanobacillus saliphilus TaxID=2925834 RepID=UPI00201D86F1|nr:dihydroorotate dehydrogenase electron transfer subunit [Oceanobacillus saliphilus]